MERQRFLHAAPAARAVLSDTGPLLVESASLRWADSGGGLDLDLNICHLDPKAIPIRTLLVAHCHLSARRCASLFKRPGAR